MKKIVYVTALALGLGVTSCSQDLLDIPQKAAATTETFYKTDADAESSLIACYAEFQDKLSYANWNDGSGWGNPMTFLLNYSSDDVYAGGLDATDHPGIREFDEFRYDASYSWNKILYGRYYGAIYACNLVIENNKGESEVINRCRAEARVMRAYLHMMLALSYDTPAIVDHLIKNGELPANDKSQEEILQWCIDECEAALPYLSERKGQDDKAGAYKVTKAFARFVAGKSAVFKGQGDWAKAKEHLKVLCEDPNYALVSGDHFYDLFHIEGNGNAEKIFETHIELNDNINGDYSILVGRGNWMGGDILSWRADLMAKGRPTIEAFPAWGGGAINHWFAEKMYKNDGNGPRRKATFFTSDEFFYDEELCPWPSDLDADGNSKGMTREEKEKDANRGITTANGMFARGLYLEHKKMPRPEDKNPTQEAHLINFNICRLAEAYLLYAEACLKSNDIAEGKKYLNAIQKRAETTETDLTIEKLMDEKQYELWFENCRFHDLVRWDRQNNGKVNGFVRVDDFTATPSYDVTIKENFDAFTDYIPQCYDAFVLTIPLPNDGGGDPAVVAVRKQQIDAMGLVKVKTVKTNDMYGYPDLFGKKHELKFYVNHPLAGMGITSRFQDRNKYFPIPSDYMVINTALKQNPMWE